MQMYIYRYIDIDADVDVHIYIYTYIYIAKTTNHRYRHRCRYHLTCVFSTSDIVQGYNCLFIHSETPHSDFITSVSA